MATFATKSLPANRDAVAPDGSDVRLLLGSADGGMAHFELAAGETSVAVAHHTVEEVWYFLGGRGKMWRKLGDLEETVLVGPGVCITIPVGTHFQFCVLGEEPLSALGVTMPPWPDEGDAYFVDGKWPASVSAGPV